jgi:hypothetical protein
MIFGYIIASDLWPHCYNNDPGYHVATVIMNTVVAPDVTVALVIPLVELLMS